VGEGGPKGRVEMQHRRLPGLPGSVLEGANGALCLIAAMHVRGNELEGGIPLEGDGLFVSQAGFVVQDLEIKGETSGCQTGHDRVVGGDVMAIALGLEGLL
jgi:hypothetical protein